MSAAALKEAFKFVPLRGYVKSPDGTIMVDGFAFQIPGFEYLHTWVTPFLGWTILGVPVAHLTGELIVSHWESGLRISQMKTAPSKEIAAELAANRVTSLGHEKVRAALGEWL